MNVEPHIAYDDEGETGTYVSIVQLDLMNASGDPLHIGLSAVIEEEGGRKSYWALAHPPGPPDFHHPDCFTLELAAPKRP